MLNRLTVYVANRHAPQAYVTMLVMDELQPLARDIRELIVQQIIEGNLPMAHYRVGNLRATIAQRLGSRAPELTPTREYESLQHTYSRLNKCFQQLESLLAKCDREASLAKADEAIALLDLGAE